MSNDHVSDEIMDKLLYRLLYSNIALPFMDEILKDLEAVKEIPETLIDDLLITDVVSEAISEEEQNRNSANLLSKKVKKAWFAAFGRGLLSVV